MVQHTLFLSPLADQVLLGDHTSVLSPQQRRAALLPALCPPAQVFNWVRGRLSNSGIPNVNPGTAIAFLRACGVPSSETGGC